MGSICGTVRTHGDDGSVDHTIGVNNTHVIRHADRILALVESSFPSEIAPDLSTVGPYDYDGRLDTAMTAHPKVCPLTGELHFFGYGFLQPYLTYHRVSAAGELVQSQVIDIPGPSVSCAGPAVAILRAWGPDRFAGSTSNRVTSST